MTNDFKVVTPCTCHNHQDPSSHIRGPHDSKGYYREQDLSDQDRSAFGCELSSKVSLVVTPVLQDEGRKIKVVTSSHVRSSLADPLVLRVNKD